MTEITLEEIKNGDVGVITHWVNQPSYIGNRIEKLNDEIIMTNKLGYATKLIDKRYPWYCKIQLQ